MKYKFYNKGMPLIGRTFKREPISLGAAAVMAGGSLLSSIFSGLFSSDSATTSYHRQRALMDYAQQLGFANMRQQQKLGHQTFDYTFGKEASLNQSLMANSPQIQKSAMIGAGINPASNFGNFSGNLAQSSAPTYTPQGSAPSAPQAQNPDFSGIANFGNSLASIVEQLSQARKNNADAHRTELDNKGKEEANDLVSSVEVKRGDDGGVLINWKKSASTVEGWNFKREYRRWITEQNKLDADDYKARLEQLIAEKQLANDDVIESMAQLPAVQLQKLCEDILNLQKTRALMDSEIRENNASADLKLTEKDLRALEKEIKENTNLYEIIKHLGDDNKPWYEKIAMVLAGVVAVASSFK